MNIAMQISAEVFSLCFNDLWNILKYFILKFL